MQHTTHPSCMHVQDMHGQPTFLRAPMLRLVSSRQFPTALLIASTTSERTPLMESTALFAAAMHCRISQQISC